MKYLILLSLLSLCACSNIKDLNENDINGSPKITGVWFFHMGTNGYLKLDLKENHDFTVSLLACTLGKEEQKPGGKWSLKGNEFKLIWPDGTTKAQELLSIGKAQLKLTSQVGYELYHREPIGCKNS